MKTLYILRHAKSAWDNPGLADHDRPLNSRGKSDLPKMGQHLKRLGVNPELIISSTAFRARRTAEGIANQLGYDTEQIEYTRRLYHAGEDEIMDVLAEVDHTINHVMVTGHNPGFTYAINYFGSYNLDNLPTCGFARIDFDIDEWHEVDRGRGKVIFIEYPKKLKS